MPVVDQPSPVTTSEQQAVPVAQGPASIWLSPICDDTADHGDGRTWASPAPDDACEDCGLPWVEYVRADLARLTPIEGVAASGETFLAQLRRINLARYEAWVEGADAGIMFDALELGGEVGELLNVVKKLEREERGWRGSRAAPEDFADECADVMICLDKLARRRNVDLAAVTIAKFNATSEKVGLPHRLKALLRSSAPTEQEVSVSVAECVESRPVGDPKIGQVEDCAGPQREAEGVPRKHTGDNTSDAQAREVALAHAVASILPVGDDRAPGDRVIPIYVRMDELRAIRELAALSVGGGA